MTMSARDWLPIETAPDEQDILIWDGRPLVAMKLAGMWHVARSGFAKNPTLWQPIEPPTSAEIVGNDKCR
jgi:hypothetical protein